MIDIGHRIKQLRVQNDLTLEELASRTELTKGFLSQLERNLTSPSLQTLGRYLPRPLALQCQSSLRKTTNEKGRVYSE
jgi:transcriptional regulator with XRE-family HTH domain